MHTILKEPTRSLRHRFFYIIDFYLCMLLTNFITFSNSINLSPLSSSVHLIHSEKSNDDFKMLFPLFLTGGEKPSKPAQVNSKVRKSHIFKAANHKIKKGKKNRGKLIIPVRKESLRTKAVRSLTNLQEAINKGATLAIKHSEKLQREMKEYFASDFEMLLLKLTRPDDLPPQSIDIDRFLATINSFVRNLDVRDVNNPYRITLRKLWRKISENDVHTVLKALYLFHNLVKFSDPNDAVIYKKLLLKMSKEYDKKTKRAYYAKQISRKGLKRQKKAKVLDVFVCNYFDYLISRSFAFTSSFEEMKLINHGMRAEDICAQLVKACKIVTSALKCKPSDNESSSEIVVLCLDLLAHDLKDLFLLFADKLQWLIHEEEVGSIFETWSEKEVQTMLSYFVEFYRDRYGETKAFLENASEILELYDKKLDSEIESPAIFSENESISQDLNLTAFDAQEFLNNRANKQ